MLAGIVLRWYSASILGKYFTFDVAIQSGQNVIEVDHIGTFDIRRYTGALLSVLGFGLVLGNWAGLMANFSCLVFAYAYRIPVEETALAESPADSGLLSPIPGVC